MMDDASYNELLSIRATAQLLAERAERLIQKHHPVSTGGKLKSALSPEAEARIIANKRKRQLKK
jgi:hypothetical protein